MLEHRQDTTTLKTEHSPHSNKAEPAESESSPAQVNVAPANVTQVDETRANETQANETQAFIRSVIQRIATGPHLSKDLPTEDARRVMRLILEGVADDVQAAIILIALRMKRETNEENTGVLQALLDGVTQVPLQTDRLCVLADPFNGCVRSLPAGPFVPSVLAACGVPALTQGALAIGPKFGLTHRHVLEAAGIPCVQSVGQTASQLESQRIGWAYLDQSVGVPELAKLAPLRRRIVKRPCLTTLESGVTPFRAARYTHLVTGFVHKAYPPVYRLIAAVAGFNGTTIIKGVEGSIVPTLSAASRVHHWSETHGDSDAEIHPAALKLTAGITADERAVPLPFETDGRAFTQTQLDALAQQTANAGVQALQGETGPIPDLMRDSIRLAATLALAGIHAGEQNVAIDNCLANARETVDTVLTSGAAAKRFTAAIALPA